MFDKFERNILASVMTCTLFSVAITSVANETETFYLLDSQGIPVVTKHSGCVQTPKTPNSPIKLFEQCGEKGDRDKDGIPDAQDVCPDNTPKEISQGVYREGDRKGCPLDSDSDGIPDYRDDCPHNTAEEIAQGVNSRGCPLDTDQDGILDYQDLCPGTPPGVAVDEHGCAIYEKPVDIVLAGDVTFAFNKSELTPQARATLDELAHQINVGFLKSIEIVGHTDSVGSQQYNQALSERRATSVAHYLVSQGVPVDRINQWGEGESHPITSNNTKIGRAKNRRVEIKITHFKKK